MQDNYDFSKLKKEKKKVNSRAKGQTFERQIAKTLNQVFNTDEFSRSPGSGAFATTHKLPKHLTIYGDLITPINFKYCIECKKGYNKEDIYSLLYNSSTFHKFIEQCEKDSIQCNKVPLVIYKQDRKPTLAITTSDMFSDIHNSITFKREGKQYSMYYLDDVLKDNYTCWFS
tara:strand:+ start:8791 stop:9306 length:516 start_codon:yes stop_codon:yes gene_type:complete